MYRLLILFIFFTGPIKAQNSEFENIGRTHYFQGRYDSAQLYYQQLVKDKQEQNPYNYYVIGECYRELKNFNSAEKYFLISMNMVDTLKHPRYFPQRLGCMGLAKLYLGNKMYEKALFYLQLAESQYPEMPACGTGRWARKLSIANKFAVCFQGLSMPDSAICYLTPFMFQKAHKFDIIDSTEYEEISMRYVKMLHELYTPSYIKNLLSCAIDASYYNLHTVKNGEKGNHFSRDFHTVNCHFNFLGSRITLLSGGFSGGGIEFYNYHTKEAALSRLSETPTYKKIMNIIEVDSTFPQIVYY